jgi:hypothetical protein
VLKIDNLLGELKDISEWKQFAESQHSTIVSLTHKKTELEAKVHHLEKMISQTTPVIVPADQDGLIKSSDEEMICKMEIAKLRDLSSARELTYDEVKKLDIFAKILNQSRNLPKTIEVKAKKFSTDELLALAESTTNE